MFLKGSSVLQYLIESRSASFTQHTFLHIFLFFGNIEKFLAISEASVTSNRHE